MKKFLTSNRFKSFMWRTGMMILATALTTIADNLNMLQVSGQVTVVIGLIFGEISKQINTSMRVKKETPVPLP